ncbi:unnamed protein product [Chironomus riparius]|uniref:Ionotropic receptor n=1 Tax=Chironomus riparius TaxID=315576 RepID=A0A9N9S9K2_9DIPT|nr:unnamed protein product [Chironomus riparius]
MKSLRFLVIFAMLLVLHSSTSTNSINTSSIDDQKLSTSICRITNDITSSKSDTQDIIIGNLGGTMWSSIVNDIIKCLDNKAVVISDIHDIATDKRLRKASVVILALNRSAKYQIIDIISQFGISTVLHHMAKTIVMLPDSTTQDYRAQILGTFGKYGTWNVAVLHKFLGDIVFEIFGSNFKLTKLINPKNSSSVFPDKLKDLRGMKAYVAVHDQQPSVKLRNGRVSSLMIHFLHVIEKVQNIKIGLLLVPDHTYLHKYWIDRKFHLTLNTALVFNTEDPKLFTYQKNGYCVLIPVPPKSSFFHLIIIHPFDILIWILFGVSVVSSVAVWRMYRDRGAVDSHWQLAAGIFMMFIGQGADFSRRNRFVLAVLLNIICLSVFLLSNLYEGAVTSFMIEPAHTNHFKTVEDFLDSDYEIITDEVFVAGIKDSQEFNRLRLKMNSSLGRLERKFNIGYQQQRYAYIFSCDILEYEIYSQLPDGHHVADYFYILPEMISWYYEKLGASYLNPFIERFQYYMDLSFQAGLPHMWKLFMAQRIYKSTGTVILRDREMLELKDFYSVFGSFNVAIVHIGSTGDIIYETVSSDFKLLVHKNPRNGHLIFPDKLKDLRGLKLSVAVHPQPPRVYVTQHTVSTSILYFLDAIEQFMNVKVKLIILPDHTYLNSYWKNRQLHLTLNTFLIFKTKDPRLFIYERNGYCALVPIPSKVPLYYLMFIKPFDGLIWILFGVSIVSSVIVLWMYRGRGAVDSHWQHTAGIFMMFIGQGADFSRRNHFILAFLLNIIYLSVFLLSKLYEGAITSSTIEPVLNNRLMTVKDLVESNYEVVNDAVFAELVKNLTV